MLGLAARRSGRSRRRGKRSSSRGIPQRSPGSFARPRSCGRELPSSSISRRKRRFFLREEASFRSFSRGSGRCGRGKAREGSRWPGWNAGIFEAPEEKEAWLPLLSMTQVELACLSTLGRRSAGGARSLPGETILRQSSARGAREGCACAQSGFAIPGDRSSAGARGREPCCGRARGLSDRSLFRSGRRGGLPVCGLGRPLAPEAVEQPGPLKDPKPWAKLTRR